MNVIDEVLAILVLYEMKLSDSPAYQSLRCSLEREGKKCQLYVYDNSAVGQPIPVDWMWKIHYHHDPTNPGVSVAYNQGHMIAKKLGLKWLLFADQDTTFPEDIFEEYTRTMAIFPECQVFAPLMIDRDGLISPFTRRMASGKRLHKIEMGMQSLCDLQAVNSGLMVSTRIFESAGGYDERLRLDFSDFDFFKKLRSHTPHMAVIDCKCRHELSSATKGDVNSAITRFKFYLQGSRVMAKHSGGFVFLLRAFLRAVKLSFRYRSIRFIDYFIGYSHSSQL